MYLFHCGVLTGEWERGCKPREVSESRLGNFYKKARFLGLLLTYTV